jgi:hypothetical protein
MGDRGFRGRGGGGGFRGRGRGGGGGGGRGGFKRSSDDEPRVSSEIQIFVEGLPLSAKIPEVVQYFSTVGQIKAGRQAVVCETVLNSEYKGTLS